MKRLRLIVAALLVGSCALGSCASPALAQVPSQPPAQPPAQPPVQAPVDSSQDPSKARVHLGPLTLNPTIALTNLGVDTNVFNQADSDVPKQDFTMTLTPQTDLSMRLGATRLNANVRADLVWFQKYASERSANTSYRLGWYVPLNRLTLTATGSRLSTRERPGFEIDARSQRYETGYGGTAELRATAKTYIGIRGDWRRVDFDKAAVFLGTNLHDELNRIEQSGAVTVRHELTPLTTLTFAASQENDRFAYSPLRDANSTSFTGTVALDPFALIKGSATVGYRHFAPVSRGLPDYRGMMAGADLSYVLLGATRFGVEAVRDIQYSYEVEQPYYVLTGVNGSVIQPIFSPFDLVARAGTNRLDYRNLAGFDVQLGNRIDRERDYGGGVGVHLGRRLRVELTVAQQTRTSGIAQRRFHGLRYGTSMTYGF